MCLPGFFFGLIFGSIHPRTVVGVKRKLRRLSSVGYLTTLLKLLCLVCPDYCARKLWKKLSIFIVGVKKKLRRLSSVGGAKVSWQTRKKATRKSGLQVFCDMVCDVTL
jgi:hypothetical protein